MTWQGWLPAGNETCEWETHQPRYLQGEPVRATPQGSVQAVLRRAWEPLSLGRAEGGGQHTRPQQTKGLAGPLMMVQTWQRAQAAGRGENEGPVGAYGR